MNRKNIIIAIVALVAVFYGGMIYGKSQVPARSQGAQTFGQNGVGGNRMQRGGNFSGVSTGEILSKDAQSITLKDRNGGSKIIFYTNKTTVNKMVNGALIDLITGKQISVTGTANTDGSINAESIQIRPTPVVAPKITQ